MDSMVAFSVALAGRYETKIRFGGLHKHVKTARIILYSGFDNKAETANK
jgi:hypothetical protein